MELGGSGMAEDAEDGAACRLVRNETGVIIATDDHVTAVLGWASDQMVGAPSTTFVHPEDQASAIAMWFDMLAKRGSSATWRGRYRTAAGGWQWVETLNTHRTDASGTTVIQTVMRPVSSAQASVADELRARRQLLSRLADAVPVGLFQFDRQRRLSFMNDRFLDMFGPDPAATCEAQFGAVDPSDRQALQLALAAVLANQLVDRVELRFHPYGTDRGRMRVCQLSLRPLTDDAGGVAGAIGSVSDVSESVELRRELQIRASTDAATGCLNRQAAMDLLDLLLARYSSSGVGVIFVDCDNFKHVNDRYGHAAGDAALVELAGRLRRCIRGADSVGRIGGDEFLVICPEVMDSRRAQEVAERIATSLEAPMAVDGRDVALRASLGVAWTDEAVPADALIAAADQAMYRSKKAGLGRPVLAPGPGGASP